MEPENKPPHQSPVKRSILLALMPYWTPSIPPLGISCLKSHLQDSGYKVFTADANMLDEFREIYDQYFGKVREYVPKFRQGNFFNVGMDVMRNHMMAQMHYVDEEQYIALTKIVFFQTFYCELSTAQVLVLNEILVRFYERLEKYILGLVEQTRPDVLGLSVFSGTLPASMFAFKKVKEKYPGVETVMGGGTFSMELVPDSPNFELFLKTATYVDKIFIGEGENLLLRYMQGKLPAGQQVYTLKDITGDNVDIKKVMVPDFSDFNIASYPQLGSWSSRSCPYQCSFCSETVAWGTYRKKDSRQILDEMKRLYQTYGVQVFMMGDSLLNIIADGLAKEFLKDDIALYWDGYMRTDPPVCKIENTMAWRQGGMYRARLGVESGSQKILDLMHKKITVDQIRQSVRCLAEAGIKTTTYWVIGHPGETEADFQATLDLIEELKDDLWEAECNPFSYYLTGQVDSDKWMKEYQRVTLYPDEMTGMLITQTWIMKNCEPSREETYERVNRFVAHCERLGIPNPYFEHEIFKADERWKRLQRNAVPALIEFKNASTYIDECKHVKRLVAAPQASFEDDAFAF